MEKAQHKKGRQFPLNLYNRLEQKLKGKQEELAEDPQAEPEQKPETVPAEEDRKSVV